MSTNNQKVRVKKIVNFNVMYDQVVEEAKKNISKCESFKPVVK